MSVTGPRTGFLGLGRMGEPMAANLVRAGVDLTVWNRSPGAAERLAAIGASVARTPWELLTACDVAILMLAHGEAIDAVLGRDGAGVSAPVADRIVVNMGTVAPSWSSALARDVARAGGTLVEAPVSGSRGPAGDGTLVAMTAGPPDALDVVAPLLDPLCRAVVPCGEVPQGSRTKLAVNVVLLSLVAGLAEAVSFAESQGLDPAPLRAVLDAGPLASEVSRSKLAAMLDGDLSPQASVRDARYNAGLIRAEADRQGVPLPLLDVCADLLGEAAALGLGEADLAALVEGHRVKARSSVGSPLPTVDR